MSVATQLHAAMLANTHSSVGSIPSVYFGSRLSLMNLEIESRDSSPNRISLSMSMNSVSRCRKTFVRLTVASMHSPHDFASNANVGCPLLVTGGSWKKSPVMMSWIPPKGLFSFLRKRRAMCASLSKRSPSSMDTGRNRAR